MTQEYVELDHERNVSLTAYLLETGGAFRNVTKRPAVIVIPGGAYMYCSDREADPVASVYLAKGYDVFILRYGVGQYRTWPGPLHDYEKAYEYIQSHAEEWHIMMNKIAVAGFSAGGHLAGAAATLSKYKPQAAILGYAALNEQIKELLDGPDITKAVSYDTPPCFLFASRADSVVRIENTIDMIQALTQFGVTYECHIYPYGPHGFSTGDRSILLNAGTFCPRARNWVEDSTSFLEDIFGAFEADGDNGDILAKPVCGGHMNDDSAAFFSIDCTVRKVFENPAARNAISDEIEIMRKEVVPFTPEMTLEDMVHALPYMKLRDFLHERGISIDEDLLNAKLARVPNI